ESYDVTAVTIDGQVSALTDKAEQQKYRTPKYDLLIVAKPTEAFSLKDKIILDQYIMSGGKVMWLVDPMTTDLDSLKMRQQTMALSNEIGISDMLFDYGVKLNRDLVLDFQSDLIVLDAGRNGEQRNWQPFSWYFAPVILSGSESHPISSNLDPIRFDFVSSMDFVGNNPDVEKTALLKSSELSKIQKAPVRVNTSIVNFDISYFEESKTNNRNLAVLLEGEFESNFRGRLNDSLAKSPEFAFKEKSLKTSMIVISDGDLARNPVVVTRDGSEIPRELGWDNNSRRVIFDNKDFLMNCANYLLNEEALVSLRSRSIELRQLNPQKRENEGQFWTTMNMILPLLVVLVFGIVVVWLKNRYYTRV
ncbi:MAG: Gldg family protein, partial [Flavobacteriales bacterium]|nr:Gldg family protein [Flavobacteriales bacterium]